MTLSVLRWAGTQPCPGGEGTCGVGRGRDPPVLGKAAGVGERGGGGTVRPTVPPTHHLRCGRSIQAVHMVVAGFLVMDSRAGSLIYSQRFSPAYGLASCDQGALTHCSYRPSYSRSLTSAACPCLPQLGTRCA